MIGPGRRIETPDAAGWFPIVTCSIVLGALLAPGMFAAGHPTPSIFPVGSPTGRTNALLPDCGGSDWPTYLGSVERLSESPMETSISVASAPGLKMHWSYRTGGEISGSPAIVDGVVYIGSWDGYEYALNASSGSLLWKAFLGLDPYGNRTTGISSSPTVIGGTVYVGGGDSAWYALNASSGAIRWNVTIDNISQGYYNWASPLLAHGHAFVGLSSKGDHPLVYAGLLQLSLKTHAIKRFFNTTAGGTLGASIWTSPALAPGTNTVYVTTGNPGPNGSVYGDSILSFNATDLRLTGNWTVPPNQTIVDGDFGATPLVLPASAGAPLVVASNKNGYLYAWDPQRLAQGPVWEHKMAFNSTLKSPPNLGPVAWSPGRIYLGTSPTRVGTVNYTGSVAAFQAATGRLLWQIGESSGPVYGSPVYADGVLAVGAGSVLQALDAKNGSVLWNFTTTAGKFLGPAAIAQGEIVLGASDGRVYAFSTGTCVPGGAPALYHSAQLDRPASAIGRNRTPTPRERSPVG